MTSRFDRHIPGLWGLLILATVLAGGAMISAQEQPEAGLRDEDLTETARKPSPAGAPETLREGTKLVNCAGRFSNTGDRVEFRPGDSEVRLVVLENLALERVCGMLAQTSGQRLWSVNGTVTEYRGVNYLLVTRAVLKSKRSPAADKP